MSFPLYSEIQNGRMDNMDDKPMEMFRCLVNEATYKWSGTGGRHDFERLGCCCTYTSGPRVEQYKCNHIPLDCALKSFRTAP